MQLGLGAFIWAQRNLALSPGPLIHGEGLGTRLRETINFQVSIQSYNIGTALKQISLLQSLLQSPVSIQNYSIIHIIIQTPRMDKGEYTQQHVQSIASTVTVVS